MNHKAWAHVWQKWVCGNLVRDHHQESVYGLSVLMIFTTNLIRKFESYCLLYKLYSYFFYTFYCLCYYYFYHIVFLFFMNTMKISYKKIYMEIAKCHSYYVGGAWLCNFISVILPHTFNSSFNLFLIPLSIRSKVFVSSIQYGTFILLPLRKVSVSVVVCIWCNCAFVNNLTQASQISNNSPYQTLKGCFSSVASLCIGVHE